MVTEPTGELRGTDDVGEHDREHGTAGLGDARRPCQEFLGGGEDALLVAGEGQVILARQLDQPSAGQVRRQIAARLDGGEPVVRPV